LAHSGARALRFYFIGLLMGSRISVLKIVRCLLWFAFPRSRPLLFRGVARA
jgi:hypothetical protein